MKYECRLCSQKFEEIPDGAVEFGAGCRGRFQLYRFPDGAIHDLRIQLKSTSNKLVPLKPAKEKHVQNN